MARCKSCSAPLLANTNICRYCSTRNDVDLHANFHLGNVQPSDRYCPECDKAMQTVTLNLPQSFQIERCETCFGVFFDPGEIEILLESSVSSVFDINKELIKNINKERYQNTSVRYVKCPVCRILMNRVNFSHRSGVIIDQCKKHGIWLESGEIIHLMEWKKAGGQLLAEKRHRQHQGEKTQPPLQKPQTMQPRVVYSQHQTDLFESVASAVFALFK